MIDSPSSQEAIRVEKVSKRFGSVTALDRVGFSVQRAELFFLLGPSGCGKTTMLRILAGLETPDEGRILFMGRDMSALPPHKRGAPMVFQNYALWPHLSVHNNVAFGLIERRLPKTEVGARVAGALERVGLTGLGDRMPGQLSGGQQQRVVLARALVLNPGVVLLDEPLSNLDAKLRAGMREEIEALHRNTDVTFVYVTHDQTEALSLADRMVVMHEGRIRAIGSPLDLYHRPPNIFCADFLGESNLIPGTVVKTEDAFLVVDTPLGRWQAVTTTDTSPRPGTTLKCLVRPEALHPSAPSPHSNHFEAVVTAVRLNGSTVTATLETQGLSFRASMLNEFPMVIEAGQRGDWFVEFENTVGLTEK